MKSSKVIGAFGGVLFLAGVACLYFGVSAQAFIWVMFLPLKAVQTFAKHALHLADERFIMFSLVVGVPLTVFYWQLWLRWSKPRVGR